jgi:hypothetical protein
MQRYGDGAFFCSPVSPIRPPQRGQECPGGANPLEFNGGNRKSFRRSLCAPVQELGDDGAGRAGRVGADHRSPLSRPWKVVAKMREVWRQWAGTPTGTESSDSGAGSTN